MGVPTSSPPRLRFLVALPLSPRPSGRRERLALGDLPARLAAAPPLVALDVGPALGAAGPRPVQAKLSRFRDFSAAEVIGQTLGELHRLATRLTAASGRPRSDEFLAAVERVAGRGPLHAELARCFAAPAAPPAQAAPAAELLDDLLSRGAAPGGASAAIDAIVRGGSSSVPAGAAAEPAKAAHALLAAALARAAAALLAAPAARAAEVRWRALKLLLGQCPKDPPIEVELLDVAAGEEAAALAELAAEDPLARPDLIVVGEPPADLAALAALAELGADLHVPVLAELAPAVLGAATLAELAERAASDALPAAWLALRDDPTSRWLALALNPPALAAEATAAGERIVCGGAALTAAALLITSFAAAGGFAQIGPAAGLRAPATYRARHVREDIALSLAEPLGVEPQLALARAGLCALAGPKDSDLIGLSACPVAARSEDPTSLGGQLLAGRTVRFALWARGELAPGADPAEAAARLRDAAALLLLPGTQLRPRFGAAIEGGALQIAASFSAALAGSPTALHFSLPLG